MSLESSPLSSSADLLASLTDETDIAEWINNLLDNGTQKSSSDTRYSIPDVTELATRLEVACQDTSSQLEQSIDDISRTVPRLTYDLHFLRESALTLKIALSSIQSRLSSSLADDETTQALQRLSYLDTVKSRMQASRDVLKEAESWSTLESEVTSLLAEPQYEKAAERLAEANRSMVVFQNTSEYETRRALMISLQNQLEATLSSALVAAINTRDMASCKSHYAIFSHIQREAEFRNYYNGSRRAGILQSWSTASLIDVEGEPSHPDSSTIKFSDFLSRFFTDFLAIVDEERNYSPTIFPDPQQTLSTFVQSTIDALTPSLSQRLSGVSEHYGELALPELIKAFRAAEDFAVATDKVLEKVGYASLFSPQTPASHMDESKPHSRRLSKRMSMSRRLGPARSSSSISGPSFTGGAGAGGSGSGGALWEQALFEPFIDLQADYPVLEKKHLDQNLRVTLEASPQPAGRTDTDEARTFRERSVNVFTIAEESLGRCMDFTHGYGAIGLIQSLNYIFTSFFNSSRIELVTSKSLFAFSTGRIPSDAFEELDYSATDWATIQLALHLLEANRVVQERLIVLETKVRAGLVQVASAFRLARSDPQGLYISNTTRGEVQLLSQSTLNSMDLRNLLDGFDSGIRSISVAPSIEQPTTLLTDARGSAVEFTKACQSMLQDTLLSPLFQHLSSYATFPTWSTETRRESGHELNIPTFSLSPTPTIQRVAEGLLNLPRLFEVYAEDDALAFSVETLPFVDAESLRAILDPSPELAASPDLRRSSSHSSIHPASSPALPSEMVVSAWLSSLTLSLLSHLTTHVLPSIRTLSASGAAQLASDLGYMSNIVKALNVEWGELEKWKEAVEMSEEAMKNKVKDEGSGAEAEVFRTVAVIKGWI